MNLYIVSNYKAKSGMVNKIIVTAENIQKASMMHPSGNATYKNEWIDNTTQEPTVEEWCSPDETTIYLLGQPYEVTNRKQAVIMKERK